MQSFASSTPLPIFAAADFQFSFREPLGKTVDEETPDVSGKEDNLFTPPPSPGRVDPNASGEENLFIPTHSPRRVVLGENDEENSPYVTSSPQSKASWNPPHGLERNKENNSQLVQLLVAPQNDTMNPLSRPADLKFIAMTGQQTTRGQRVRTEPRTKVPSRKRKSRPNEATTVPSPSKLFKRQRTSNPGGFSSQQNHFDNVTPISTTLDTLTWEQVRYLPVNFLDDDEPPAHAQPGSYIDAGFTAIQPWWG